MGICKTNADPINTRWKQIKSFKKFNKKALPIFQKQY